MGDLREELFNRHRDELFNRHEELARQQRRKERGLPLAPRDNRKYTSADRIPPTLVVCAARLREVLDDPDLAQHLHETPHLADEIAGQRDRLIDLLRQIPA